MAVPKINLTDWTFGRLAVAGLRDMVEAMESGEPINERTYRLRLRPSVYDGRKVRGTRLRLGTSQTIFAGFIGVSPVTVRSWEQGKRRVPPMACRFLDELDKDPEYWKGRLIESLVAKP